MDRPIGWLYCHEDTEGWKFAAGRPSRPGDPTFECMQVYASAPALAAEVERLRLALQEAQHELESCDNCPPDVLERIEAALARQEAGPDLYPNNIGRL